MTHVTPHPSPGKAAFSIAIATGMRMAVELVATVGPAAVGAVGHTFGDELTEMELGVLSAAVARVIQMRQTPNDLSAMSEPIDVAAAPCPNAACQICRGGEAA